MTDGAPDAVSWFVQTAGTASGQGYRWLAITAGGDPREAARLVQGEVAGRAVVSFLSDSALSVVVGWQSDGRCVLVASGLRPVGAPPKGDHMHRPIRATLVGVVPVGGDLTPLLRAAAAAVGGTLADALPVAWTDDGPVAASAGSWRPPVTRPSRPVLAAAAAVLRDRPAGGPLDRGTPDSTTLDSVAVPDTDEDRLRLAAELTTTSSEDLEGFDDDRPLVLATPLLDREDLTALRPWRAVTSSVRQRTTLTKEGRSRTGRSCAEIVAAVFGLVMGLAVVAWAVLHRVVGR